VYFATAGALFHDLRWQGGLSARFSASEVLSLCWKVVFRLFGCNIRCIRRKFSLQNLIDHLAGTSIARQRLPYHAGGTWWVSPGFPFWDRAWPTLYIRLAEEVMVEVQVLRSNPFKLTLPLRTALVARQSL
jgi:hypothetical protein